MAHTIHTLQAVFGLLFMLVLLGWSLWRLAGWMGLITIKRAKVKFSSKQGIGPTRENQIKSTGTIAKKAYYSAKRDN